MITVNNTSIFIRFICECVLLLFFVVVVFLPQRWQNPGTWRKLYDYISTVWCYSGVSVNYVLYIAGFEVLVVPIFSKLFIASLNCRFYPLTESGATQYFKTKDLQCIYMYKYVLMKYQLEGILMDYDMLL